MMYKNLSIAVAALVGSAAALNNGLARTPQMGYLFSPLTPFLDKTLLIPKLKLQDGILGILSVAISINKPYYPRHRLSKALG